MRKTSYCLTSRQPVHGVLALLQSAAHGAQWEANAKSYSIMAVTTDRLPITGQHIWDSTSRLQDIRQDSLLMPVQYIDAMMCLRTLLHVCTYADIRIDHAEAANSFHSLLPPLASKEE